MILFKSRKARRASAGLFCALIISLLPSATLRAQGGKGSITGRASDSGGGALQGARIELQPGGAAAVTNNQGEFRLRDIAPGAYKITASFVGFEPFTTDVTVIAGRASQVEAVLPVATKSEEVLVTAERPHGEAEAINRELTAPNILQVLTSEVITSLPNANVADAIGRLPSVTLERDEGEGKYVQIRGTEPRYSNVTIDGVNVASPENVRQIKLDIIPSDLVESVEINKTLLANMDGDAIGGSVNLRTKSAGEQPTLSLSGLGGYTPIFNGRTEDQFGGTLGKRFGKEKRLGILVGGTYDWNGRGIDDIEPAPQAIQCDPKNCLTPSDNAPSFGTYAGIDLREYRYYRARWGLAGSLDYKLDERSNVYVHGLFSHFDNFGERWVYSPTINSYTTSPLQGGDDGSMAFNASIRRPVQTIGSLAAGGQHYFSNSWVSWEISASRSATRDKGYSQANYGPADGSPLNNVQFGIDLSNPYRPKFPVQNGVNIYDPSQYVLQNLDVNTTYGPQVNLQAGASYAKNYGLGGHYGIFEIGAKVRNVHKFNEANDVFYNAVNPNALPMTKFLNNVKNTDYYDNSYQLGPFVDFNAFKSFFASTPGAFAVDVSKTRQRNDPQTWDLTERVAAGYLQNSISFGKFRLYTGLRFEGTNEGVRGNMVVVDAKGNYASTSALTKNSSYLDPLPSAQLKYSLTPDSSIRVAYGRGIARPNYGDLAPYFTLNDRRNSISAGNPDLKPTRANNYDVLYEYYLKPLGLIQAGFFYKDISDPIYFVNKPLTSGTYAGFSQTQPINGSSAHVAGFEVAYQQRLSFLPGPLAGMGLSANYSYTTSQANGVPGRSDHPPLQRQAPHTWNVSPTYDRGRISLRAGLSYNAANIFQYNYTDGAPLGLQGPNGDVYLYAHFQVDAQGSIRLAKGFSAIVYGLNLNNEVFGFYQGSGIWPIQREYYRTTVAAGLRWSLPTER